AVRGARRARRARRPLRRGAGAAVRQHRDAGGLPRRAQVLLHEGHQGVPVSAGERASTPAHAPRTTLAAGPGAARMVVGAVLLLGLVEGGLLALLAKLRRQQREREAAERELSAQEQKYQRLLDNLSTYFVYGKGADGRLTFVSESVRRVLGWSPAEIRQRFPTG